ncbi:MAG: condensation domain-containing protein, partial [Lysobacteraceae bacterium]
PEPVAGIQRLLPIQIEYFAQGREDIDRYAQYATFALPDATSVEQLRQALHALVLRHDALRLRFRSTTAGWVAQYRPEGLQAGDAAYADAIVEIDDDGRSAEACAADALTTLDIRQGRLLRWCVRRSAAGDRLLWVMHHLVVDGVSWRVLESDFREALSAAREEAPLAFGPASMPLQAWAAQVHDFALGAEAQVERDYWLHQLADDPPRLLDADAVRDVVPESRTRVLDVILDASATSALFRHIGAGIKVQTLLLAALGRALGQRLDSDRVRIDLEGHGRAEDANLSATIGWFTVLYPQRLDAMRAAPARALHAVQQALAAVPRGGLGYGALRHLALDEAIDEACEALGGRPSDVLFNYLGLFSAGFEGGAVCGPARPRTHALRVNAAIFDGRLQMRFDYAEGQLDDDGVRAIADGMRAAIDEFTGLSLAPGWDRDQAPPAAAALECSPTGLDAAALDALRARMPDLEDAFPCSSMQQGLLIFSTAGAQKDLYLTQMTLRLGAVDGARMRRAWQALVARHAMLRSAFVDVGADTLIQAVLREVELPWLERDLGAMATDAADAAFAAHAREAMEAGFDLAVAPLMRLLLVRMGKDDARLVWTHHHALLDGWSAAQLIGELCALYDTDAPSSSPPPMAYRTFVEWLAGRDRAAAEAY